MSSVTSVKTLARDLVRRHMDRSSRPFRILRDRHEFSARRHAAERLDGVQSPYLAALHETGFVRFDGSQILVRELVDASRRKLAEAEALPQRGNKPFFSQLLATADRMPASVFLRFALDEELLKLVAAYLRCAPFLNSVELLYSKPMGAGPMASQLWHRDRRDLAIIKVFVYATDVEPANGPLTMLPKEESRKVPEYLPHYLGDEQVGRYASLEKAAALTGPAGTTWVVDSENCYHLGSRCERPRLAYVAFFDSGFGYRPRETDWRTLASSAANWTPLQRYALGLE